HQTSVDRLPCFAAVIRPERARGRDRDEYPLWIFRIDQNRVKTHSARTGLPTGAGIVLAQAGKLAPAFSAIFRFESCRILYARINMIDMVKRRLQMPDAFEFPRMLRAVVPL